jgi:hypothetical protein
MPQINSSGAVERFTLAAGESKVFVTEDPGGNSWALDLHGDSQETANASVLFQSSEGQASATLLSTTSALTFTAVAPGVGGNAISITYADPGGTTATASVVVVGNAITLNLGRAASAVNTTADAAKILIDASPAARALVGVVSGGAGLLSAVAQTFLAGGHFGVSTAYATVSTTAVVPGGIAAVSGVTGRYAKILNNGANAGLVHVVAKPMRIVQVAPGI